MSLFKATVLATLLSISTVANAKIIEFNATFTVEATSGFFNGAENNVSATFFVDDSYGQNTAEEMNITSFEFMLNGQNLGSSSSYWTAIQAAKFWNDTEKTTTTPFTYNDELFNDVFFQASNEKSLPSIFKASVLGSDNPFWYTSIRDEDNNILGQARGSFAITGPVSAVPEPSNMFLFIGGLAILGFVTTRRKAKNSVSA
ncbi:MAG: PEP-CTERM sorting domain-containing protein [Thiotrichales bacterium]|nr:PEP-CTERM sorting domain-containing protein [Thiotrichales bacterium]